MRSMTGFGRYIMEDSGLTQQWEVRSVNGKRLELKWSLPAAVRNMESRFEKIVKRRASRGRHHPVTAVRLGTLRTAF